MSLKDHITTAAINLFSRNGIKRVSMDDVARKANVSKRTLYDFFRDKESLLIEVLDKIREPFSEQIGLFEKRSDTALEAMLLFNEKLMEKQTWLCDDFFEDIKRYPKAFQILLEGKRVFLNKIIELLKRGEKESVFMSDIDYDLISLMAQQQMSKPASSEGIFTKYTHEEVHNTIFFIFLRGISTDAGRDILDKFITKKRYKKGFIPEKM
ncbi:MAG: TetR/AcrR family transcriptional regulator [Tannerella sp.]|jgi:AcrR family transcriptional regulator|nr:TetR/AcrR family transcriptional regulator [Tannerella sp.]